MADVASTIPELMRRTGPTAVAYERLLNLLLALPESRIEEKKTCVHVVAGKAAFLGVHPRKGGLRLNIVLSRPLESERVVKAEQVSRSRFHNEIDLSGDDSIDAELESWIREACSLQVL